MNIIKGLTAVTSLTVFMGMMGSTSIAQAITNSTDDNQIVNKSKAADSFGTRDSSIENQPAVGANLFGNGLLQQEDSNQSVEALQKILQQIGYYKETINGHFDHATRVAVNAFQSDSKLSDSGFVGAATKTALFNTYRHTSEYKEYHKQLAEIKRQEKKAKREKIIKEAKERAERAAAAKAAAARAAAAKEKQKLQKQAAARQHQPAPKTIHHAAKAVTGRSLTVMATAYALGGRTATGIDFSSNPAARVIAVDPNVIPLGAQVNIPGYGVYRASDTGGAIKGNRIDIHFGTKNQALAFGARTMTVQILN